MDSGANEVARQDEAGSSGTTIEINIKTMDSQTYTMHVDRQMPVPALKEQIASVTGVVTEHQRLICRGKVLKDDQLLSAYHVEDGHTLHLVVREPASSSSQSLPADPAADRPSGNRGQFYQVAPGIVVETFNMPGQGDRGFPDISRIISAVLGSVGSANPGSASEGTGIREQGAGTPVTSGSSNVTQTHPEQSGLGGQNDRSRLPNAFGIPAAVAFGSLQAPVIPDALTTLSQYLSHMRLEFVNNGRPTDDNNGTTPLPGNEGGSSTVVQAERAQEGLPTPASLAELLLSTRQMLNQQTEECLLELGRQLENQANVTDPVARVNAQSSALRTGILLQNLGAYFLELGRTITTLRLGRSSSEAVVNAGPAVFISPSGPNPLMVQPLPFQPGTSFGAPLSGTLQSGSGLINGLGGAGFVPRRIDIQIRRGPSAHQTEPAGSQQSLGQRDSSTILNGETQINQPAARDSDSPTLSSGGGNHMLPFRTMMASVPDLNRLPSESPGASIGVYYPILGRSQNFSSGNLSGRTGSRSSVEHHSNGIRNESNSSPESAAYHQPVQDPAGNGRVPALGSEQRESVASRTIDINILSSGGIQNDQNVEGEISPGTLQFLRRLFPGGEFQVESVGSQGTAVDSVTDQGRTASATAEEAEPRATEEGIFLSSLLQHIMPFISNDTVAEQNVANPGGDASQHTDGSPSTYAEDSEVETSRRSSDLNPGPPSAKRQKME